LDYFTLALHGALPISFCYIIDNIDACLIAFHRGEVVNDVANIGSDVEISIKQLADLIIDLTGSRSRIVHLPPLEEGDMTRRMPEDRKSTRLNSRHVKI